MLTLTDTARLEYACYVLQECHTRAHKTKLNVTGVVQLIPNMHEVMRGAAKSQLVDIIDGLYYVRSYEVFVLLMFEAEVFVAREGADGAMIKMMALVENLQKGQPCKLSLTRCAALTMEQHYELFMECHAKTLDKLFGVTTNTNALFEVSDVDTFSFTKIPYYMSREVLVRKVPVQETKEKDAEGNADMVDAAVVAAYEAAPEEYGAASEEYGAEDADGSAAVAPNEAASDDWDWTDWEKEEDGQVYRHKKTGEKWLST
jgi:hypothetical protein